MKKGIKACLYFPKEYYKIIEDRFEEIKNYLETHFNIDYSFYIGEFNENEVCGIDVLMLAKTRKEVNEDYRHFKEYIKEIMHKQPHQILKLSFDRI